jgi:hypothetical protein
MFILLTIIFILQYEFLSRKTHTYQFLTFGFRFSVFGTLTFGRLRGPCTYRSRRLSKDSLKVVLSILTQDLTILKQKSEVMKNKLLLTLSMEIENFKVFQVDFKRLYKFQQYFNCY